jgi:proteic killer suppression protein
MIISYNHIGLKEFHQSGKVTFGLRVSKLDRLNDQLAVLSHAQKPQEMNIPGWGFCSVTRNFQHYWAVNVSDSYYLIFQFKEANATNVDLVLRLEIVHEKKLSAPRQTT